MVVKICALLSLSLSLQPARAGSVLVLDDDGARGEEDDGSGCAAGSAAAALGGVRQHSTEAEGPRRPLL